MSNTASPRKRVLIITYYWPPSGGVGVQRWLKFAKYLPGEGWDPIIYTPENPDFGFKDPELVKDVGPEVIVLKHPIWEPFSLFNKATGNTKHVKQGQALEKEKTSWKDNLFVWIRGNLLLPDARRFWIRPSVKYLTRYLKENPVDAIISTGPPHSILRIGYHLSKKVDIPWIADFRDPWSDWDILGKLRTGKIAMSLHRRWEKQVLQRADKVTTVSSRMVQLYEQRTDSPVALIYNGYDADQVARQLQQQEPPSDRFTIFHVGLLNEIRNPEVLWKVLEQLAEEDEAFAEALELRLAGSVSDSVIARIKRSPKLAAALNHLGFIAHDEVMRENQRARVLLTLMNQNENARWILPKKLFEYLAIGRPVMVVGFRDSDVGRLLESASGELPIEFDDAAAMKEKLQTLFANYQANREQNCTYSIESFSIAAITTDLARQLDTLISHE